MASLAARPLYHRCTLGRRLDETAVVVGAVGTWEKNFSSARDGTQFPLCCFAILHVTSRQFVLSVITYVLAPATRGPSRQLLKKKSVMQTTENRMVGNDRQSSVKTHYLGCEFCVMYSTWKVITFCCYVSQLASSAEADVKECRVDSSSVIPVDEVSARSPKIQQQLCEDSSGSKQEEDPDVPSATATDGDHFSASKPSLFTIEYLMKMPSALPSRRAKSAVKH